MTFSRKRLRSVRDAVEDEIRSSVIGDSHVGRALAQEGYAAGYRDALDDILLAMAGIQPNRRFWPNEKENSNDWP
jgi:hypothetical protein